MWSGKSKRWFVVVGCVLLMACDSPAESETPKPSASVAAILSAPAEVTLRLGEESAVGGGALYLSFLDVLADTRCPVGVVCAQPGNAEVSLGLRVGTGPTHTLRLNTDVEPKSADWMSLRLSMGALMPTFRAVQPGDSIKYQLRVRVEPVSP